MTHQTCLAILLGEFFMGIQPWWKSKSFIAAGLVICFLIFWWVAIKPLIWLFEKGNKNETSRNSGS